MDLLQTTFVQYLFDTITTEKGTVQSNTSYIIVSRF